MRRLSSEPTRWRFFAAGNMLNNVGEPVLVLALPLLLLNVGANLATVSMVWSAQLAAFFLSHQLGTVADRIGPTPAMVGGQLILIATTVPAIILVRQHGVEGAFEASILAVALFVAQCGVSLYRKGWSIAIFSLFPETLRVRRSQLSELYYFARFIGPASAAIIVATLGLDAALYVALALATTPILAWMAGVRPTHQPSTEHATVERLIGFRVIAGDADLLSLSASSMVLGLSAGSGMLLFMIYELVESLEQDTAWVFLLAAGSGLVGWLTNRWAGRGLRTGRYRADVVIFRASLLAIVGLLVVGMGSFAGIAVGWLLVTAALGANGNADAVISIDRAPPESYAQFEGARDVLAAIAMVLGPQIVAFGLEHVGARGTATALATLTVLAPLAIWLGSRRELRFGTRLLSPSYLDQR